MISIRASLPEMVEKLGFLWKDSCENYSFASTLVLDVIGSWRLGALTFRNSKISRKNLSGLEQSRLSNHCFLSMPRPMALEGIRDPLPAFELFELSYLACGMTVCRFKAGLGKNESYLRS